MLFFLNSQMNFSVLVLFHFYYKLVVANVSYMATSYLMSSCAYLRMSIYSVISTEVALKVGWRVVRVQLCTYNSFTTYFSLIHQLREARYEISIFLAINSWRDEYFFFSRFAFAIRSFRNIYTIKNKLLINNW